MSHRPRNQHEPVIGPGALVLHLPKPEQVTRCGMPMVPALFWRAWGISYTQQELVRAIPGLICRACVGELTTEAVTVVDARNVG